MSLQLFSGTFSYTGIKITIPENKSPITVQGHNGMVERVGYNYSRGQAPISVEGRLLPLFDNEIVYVQYVERNDGTPYEIKPIVQEIAEAAGVTVTYNIINNNKLKSFEFMGRFTEALEQLAELSCGRLLQQNGVWIILPKYTSNGTVSISNEDIISYKLDIQSDIMDTIASLAKYLKDAILARDLAQRLIDRILNKLAYLDLLDILPDDPVPLDTVSYPSANVKFGEINFSFGYDGKTSNQLKEDILVDGLSSSWDTWPLETDKKDKYYKREIVSDDKGKALYWRGLKTLDRVRLYYPFTPPSNAGQYFATGTLTNLSCLLWNGDPSFADTMIPVLKSKQVTGLGEKSTTFALSYFEFTRDIFTTSDQTNSADDLKMYSAKMELSYKPCVSLAYKFVVTIDKTFRVISGVNYLIPIAGGNVLNSNGNTVAVFDINAQVIELQNKTIISTVICEDDILPQPIVNPTTGETTYTALIKGAPIECVAPIVDPGGTSITIVGLINPDRYVLRTKAGRFFGTIDELSGDIYYANGDYIGNYTTNIFLVDTTTNDIPELWSVPTGIVIKTETSNSTAYIGLVQNATDTGTSGSISFTNAVTYPLLTADTNYTTMQSTLLNYELAKAKTDLEIAKAKIECLKKELDYYGVDYSGIIYACEKWKIYYDACELRDFPPLVRAPAVPPTPEPDDVIKSYETIAITETGLAMVGLNASTPRNQDLAITTLYNNSLPLPGMELTIDSTILGTNIATTDLGIIETVSFDGQKLNITTKRGFNA
jgi:hypothetical protein